MNRWLRPLRQLQGRLTLTYILVALVAMLTLTLGTAAWATIQLQAPTSLGGSYPDKEPIQATSLYIAPAIAPYLEQNPPDVRDLNLRLASMVQPVAESKAQQEVGGPPLYPDLLGVLSRDNQLLATSHDGTDSFPAILANAKVQSVIGDARTGDQLSERLAAHLPDGRTAVASPLFDYAYRLVGVALAVYSVSNVEQAAVSTENSQANAVSRALTQLVPGAILFVLGSSALGTLVGVFFSRSLTRRLRNIARAAHDWSTGEFHVTVQDRFEDEIGQLAHDLNDMAGQLQQLVTARQELAVVEERHRLARDLHDSIKQQLFVMTMLVGTARAQAGDQPQVVQSLDEAEQIATQTHQELTALIRALRPTALAGKSFGVALCNLIRTWSRSTGIDALIRVSDAMVVPSDMEQTLFRVAQEALANVARHSGATAITVEAGTEPTTIHLEIADNGRGFIVDAAMGKGLGLASMRERVAALGGTLTLASSDLGTHLSIDLPTFTNPRNEVWAHYGTADHAAHRG